MSRAATHEAIDALVHVRVRGDDGGARLAAWDRVVAAIDIECRAARLRRGLAGTAPTPSTPGCADCGRRLPIAQLRWTCCGATLAEGCQCAAWYGEDARDVPARTLCAACDAEAVTDADAALDDAVAAKIAADELAAAADADAAEADREAAETVRS